MLLAQHRGAAAASQPPLQRVDAQRVAGCRRAALAQAGSACGGWERGGGAACSEVVGGMVR